MARTANLNGTNYSVPEPGDTGYDQALTNYLVALASAFPQLGGVWTLLTELDLGAAFGLKALYFKTRSALPSLTGILRLATGDGIGWRNNANGADVLLAKDTADALTFGGQYVTGLPMAGANTAGGQSIAAGATEAIVVFGTVERDSDSGYNAGTGRYTVPAGKGGDYTIEAAIAYSTAPTGTCTASIYKNAALLKSFQAIAPGAQQSLTIGATVTLVAGDVIDIRTKHGNAGAQTLQATAALNYFSLKRIPT